MYRPIYSSLLIVFGGIGMCAVAFATPQRRSGGENDVVPEHNLEELPSDLIGYTLLHLSRTLI
ncbi:hypothetical protein FNV43_RR13987 [Rhamnella rubrinervis]|uniref:Uncharacterized protein n=1 Tax=Rhamnella rubrinervis TaxID=2594499 RepID=A0A8K0H255_9ROSA|nr:hypothetical protein FNV43_RR13987 [Rhamnella rubrinervis]